MLLIRKYFEETNRTKLEVIKEILEDICLELNPSFIGENFEVSEIASQNGFKNDLDYYFNHYKEYYKIDESNLHALHLFLDRMIFEISKGCESRLLDFIITKEDIIIAIHIVW